MRYLLALLLAACTKHDGFHERMLRYHSWSDPHVPAGASIFLGDSITQGLAVSAVAPLSVNYGIGSQTTEQLVAAIPRYQSLKRAKHIYVMIGANDSAPDYRLLVAALPDVPIVWSGVPGRKSEDAKAACASLPRCTFVDLSDAPLSDDVHLTPEGYRLWITRLHSVTKP